MSDERERVEHIFEDMAAEIGTLHPDSSRRKVLEEYLPRVAALLRGPEDIRDCSYCADERRRGHSQCDHCGRTLTIKPWLDVMNKKHMKIIQSVQFPCVECGGRAGHNDNCPMDYRHDTDR